MFITSLQADEPHEAPYGNGAAEGWGEIPHYVPALLPHLWHTLLPAVPPRDRPQPSRVRMWVPFQLIQRSLDLTRRVLKSYHSSFYSTLQDLRVVIWQHSHFPASYEKLSQARWNALHVSGNPHLSKDFLRPLVLKWILFSLRSRGLWNWMWSNYIFLGLQFPLIFLQWRFNSLPWAPQGHRQSSMPVLPQSVQVLQQLSAPLQQAPGKQYWRELEKLEELFDFITCLQYLLASHNDLSWFWYNCYILSITY